MKTTLIKPGEELAQREREGFISVEQYVGEIRRNDVGFIVRPTDAEPTYHPASGVLAQRVETLERITMAGGAR